MAEKEIQRCTICNLPSNYPGITFDEKGKLTGRAPRIMVSQNGAFTFMEE